MTTQPEDVDEAWEYLDALRATENALDELEGCEPDEDSVRELEVLLDSLASSIAALLRLHPVHSELIAPDMDLFPWLCDQGLLEKRASATLGILLEVSKMGRYGEEIDTRNLKRATKAQADLVGYLRAMLKKW